MNFMGEIFSNFGAIALTENNGPTCHLTTIIATTKVANRKGRTVCISTCRKGISIPPRFSAFIVSGFRFDRVCEVICINTFSIKADIAKNMPKAALRIRAEFKSVLFDICPFSLAFSRLRGVASSVLS